MSKKYDTSKKNVVVVGGGFAGSAAVKELVKKVDSSKYNVILITSRPYYVHLVALLRMAVSDIDDLENQALVPYDKLPGIVHRVGTVTTIEESGPGEGGSVVLADGEKIPYAVLLLATGSIWSGPANPGESDQEIRNNLKEWRTKFTNAKHVVIVGGGAVGIETAGEIKDIFPDKKVTLVHAQPLLLSGLYVEKFRRYVESKVRDRGIELVLGEAIDEFPEAGQTADITTRSGKTLKGVDLVVPAFGARPNTAFIGSLGSDALTENGTVKIKPTFELLYHPGIFAAGDIVEWKEAKQAAKAPKHASIATTNIISFLNGEPQKVEYKGQPEMIIIPVGKSYGAGYLNLLWGITLGNFFTSLLKGKGLFVSQARKGLNY